MDKRFKHLAPMQEESLLPSQCGAEDADILVLCWGSTKLVVEEAVRALNRPEVASLHFSQLYPFNPGTADILKNASKLIILEGNMTGQLAKLVKLHLDIDIESRILKYNGLQYTVEEVIAELKRILG